MTMAVNLTLTADQAALLAPILQQISSIASQSTQGQASTPLLTLQATAVTMSSPTSPSNCGLVFTPREQTQFSPTCGGVTSGSDVYSTDELLSKKTKNDKSSPAQKFFTVSNSTYTLYRLHYQIIYFLFKSTLSEKQPSMLDFGKMHLICRTSINSVCRRF